ncbi:MAG TPA: PD-(D/E)XK nuclease family protein [Nitrososphaera sp.]|jgi:hypothetical protein|nr:PD-(D/E)XK nuclease family protein [Nitrososphaera sp.]
MASIARNDKLQKILSLLHDPTFVSFELEQEAPSIFNAVGRTHTETWHSALLGWLFDPTGSHQLGSFPLTRLILLLKTQDTLELEKRGMDLNELLMVGDLLEARVRPNERELAEVSVVGIGRFDILIDRIKLEPWREVQLLIETKVKSKISLNQCNKYIGYIEKKRAEENVFTLPVFIAPTSQLIGTPKELFGHETWFAIDYQSIYDEVIEPCLLHPVISDFGRFTLSEYTKTLKYRQQGGNPLVITQKERDMVSALMERHELAIRALYEILSQSSDEFEQIGEASSTALGPIKIKIGNSGFEQPSVSKLYQQVLKFLYDGNYLSNLELPIATGSKRYLLSTEPRHQRGNEFVKPVEYKGYFMEAHKSRDGALRDLAKLLEMSGLSMKIVQ